MESVYLSRKQQIKLDTTPEPVRVRAKPLKIVKAQALWTAIFIVGDYRVFRSFCGGFFFLLQSAMGLALCFLCLFFLASAFFLSFSKGTSRSCHAPSW